MCKAFILPCCNTAPYKRLQRVLCRPCSYATNAAKQRTGLYSGFSCDCARSTAHDTRPTQAAIIPPVPRWSVSQRRSTSSAYKIPPPRRTLYRSAQPPYYNKVYIRVQGCAPVVDPCQTAQHIADHASPAHLLRGQRPHLHRVSPAACNLAPVSSQDAQGQPGTLHPAVSPAAGGAAGGAEPLTATAVSLFGLSPDS